MRYPKIRIKFDLVGETITVRVNDITETRLLEIFDMEVFEGASVMVASQILAQIADRMYKVAVGKANTI